MNKQKGFTIIELIVVIAIIAVLAAIVLVNVTQYINKGKNAAIKGNMASMMTNSATYFDDNSTKFGTNFVSDTGTGFSGPADAIVKANGNTPVTAFGAEDNQHWCACSPLYTVTGETGTFCVDSTGYKLVTVGTCETRCVVDTPQCVDGVAP